MKKENQTPAKRVHVVLPTPVPSFVGVPFPGSAWAQPFT